MGGPMLDLVEFDNGGRHPDPVRQGPFYGATHGVHLDHYERVAKGGGCTGHPFIADIEKWLFVGGGYDAETGQFITKPAALAEAEIVDTLAQRYGVLPGAILRESTALLRLVSTVEAG